MSDSIDRFDLLPDSLHIHIVSFLPFREAAQTCILAKSWQKIWEATKNVDFNELFFVKSDQTDETREAQRQIFLNFIEKWLENCNEHVMDKFSLKLSMPENVHEVIEKCIAFATQRGVKSLKLDFSDPNWEEENFNKRDALFELPMYVYGQASLESLKLYSCGFVMPDLLQFRALKDVSLGWMELEQCTVKRLLENCPMIESLSLKKCWNLSSFYMGEQQYLGLRRLVIDKCHFHTDLICTKAPNLRFFKFSGSMSFFVIDELCPSIIEEADLDFSLETEEFADILYNLLVDIYAARVLTVCSYLLQVIPLGEEPLRIPSGLNARHLIMKTELHQNEYYGIRFLLNSCSMLETLTIELGPRRIFDDYDPPFPLQAEKFWFQDVTVHQCLRSSLSVVEVKGFIGTMNEIRFLCYLILCGRVLRKINIYLKEDVDDRKMRIYRTRANYLPTVPKASQRLEIQIF